MKNKIKALWNGEFDYVHGKYIRIGLRDIMIIVLLIGAAVVGAFAGWHGVRFYTIFL